MPNLGFLYNEQPFVLEIHRKDLSINREEKNIYGLPAFKDVRDIAGPVDLAILMVPSEYVDDKIIPKFTPDITIDELFPRRRATLFLNFLPYDRFNCVTIFSHTHFLSLGELSPEIMADGFLACRDYFKAVKAANPAV